jgi:cytochrome c553
MTWISDRLWPALGLALVVIPACATAADIKRGEALYEVCGSCHGDKGQGEDRMAVPAIAGQDRSYLLRQLRNFAQGLRGGPPDSPANQMVAIMKFVSAENDWIDIVAFVGTLPSPPSAIASKRDLHRGAQLYSTCAACHGARGEGNPELLAPRLAGLQEWYIVAQLQNFRSGARGSAAADTAGSQMRAASAILLSDAEQMDVAAYIAAAAAPAN